jgi:hypothetical protein
MPRKYKKSTIINENQDKLESDESRHYVDKQKFYEALVERKKLVDEAEKNNLPKPQISNYIGECILKISTNLAKKYQFSGYTFKDEMIADSVIHCLKYIDAFDITKSENPFSYFTQAAYYQFIKRIETEKTQTYVKCKATMNSTLYGDFAEYGIDSDDHKFEDVELDTEFMDSFIGEYENKLQEKDAAKEAAKLEKNKKSINKDSLEYYIEYGDDEDADDE